MDIQTHEQSEQESQLSKRERREMRRNEVEHERKQHGRMKSVRRATMWSIVVVALVGLTFVLYKAVRSVPSTTGGVTLSVPVSDQDWSLGDKNAKVTLVEYSDFQCPACGAFHPLIQQLLKETGSDVRFIYRHFPLYQIHPNAEIAGKAAESAGIQGKFWEMHDLLFENQKEWADQKDPVPTFVKYATQLKLNVAQFQTDIKSSAVAEAVNADYTSGVQMRLNATPTFFINGKQMPSVSSYDEFKKNVTNALAENQ